MKTPALPSLILTIAVAACGQWQPNPTAEPPAYGLEVSDIHQGTLPDCYLLAVLGAFADKAPHELAYALNRLGVAAAPSSNSTDTQPSHFGFQFNRELDPTRPDWPAAVELALLERGTPVNKPGMPEQAAYWLGLDGGTNEIPDPTLPGLGSRPVVACTENSPKDPQLFADHCYVVLELTKRVASLYDVHGVTTDKVPSPYIKIALPSADLFFVGF